MFKNNILTYRSKYLKTAMQQTAVVLVVISLLLGQVMPVRAQEGTPPTPTPTDVPTETVTPTPTATNVPVETVTPTPSNIPTETPVPPTGTTRPSETPTATLNTSTPVTSSATPTATGVVPPTATSGVTPTATVTAAPALQYLLTLSSHPGFMTQSRMANLEWQVQGISAGQSGLTLTIYLPLNYEPRNGKSGEHYDAATHTYTIPVSDTNTQGVVQIRALQAIENVTFSASLASGGSILAEDAMILPMHEQFDVNTHGGQVAAMNGKVKVTVPDGALPENVVLDAGFPTDDALPQNGYTGKVFELKAHSKKNEDVEISHFNQPLTIEVYYGDMNLSEQDENNLYLYWYNQQTGDWSGMETLRDKNAKILRATTNHFTVFDVSVNNWQAARLPSVESFQVSQFTGAGSYSMPITVPEGPGGFKPNITLSYNSQVVDSATTDTQASWVGMGWSLDGGGSIQDNNDGTYSLEVNGVSTRIGVKRQTVGGVVTKTYHALDENFWKITCSSVTLGGVEYIYSWTVYDTQGNEYVFGDGYDPNAPLPRPHTAASVALGDGDTLTWTPYAWYLATATNPSNQTLTYDYFLQNKVISNANHTQAMSAQTAVYLSTITYPHGRYQILFSRAADRTDYRDTDETDALYHMYQKSRLKYVYVKQDADGDVNNTYETIIRRYDFLYAGYDSQPTTEQIWPGVNYSAGGKVLTLTGVREVGYGDNGTNLNAPKVLPWQTFQYGDDMHLTHAENGYGGGVTFDYENTPWYTTTMPPTDPADPDNDMTNDYVRDFTADDFNNLGLGCMDAWWGLLGSGGSKSCSGKAITLTNGSIVNAAYFSRFGNLRTLTRPGGMYQLDFRNAAVTGGTYQTGIWNGTGSPDLGPVNDSSYPLRLKATASTARLYMTTTGSVSAIPMIRLLPAYYRVTSKTVSDGNGHNDIASYDYSDPLVSATTYAYMGNGTVTETAPDGTQTATQFYQDEYRKGRAWQTHVYQPDGTLQRWTVNNYLYKAYTVFNLHYVHGWVYLDAQINRVYNNNGGLAGTTRTEYDYDEETHISDFFLPLANSYGNQTVKRECDNASDCATYYRKTLTQYAPNAATYIVSLPKRELVYSATDALLADTLNFYDGATSYSTAPTKGLLTRKQVRSNGANYAQTDYVYDNYGNQTQVNVCTAAVVVNQATCGGSTQNTTTTYDPDYHTYATRTINALNQAINFTYDYRYGVPKKMVDANGNTTTATYDYHGRMTSITRPLDTDATLSMSYSDNDPNNAIVTSDGSTVMIFSTTITQKIDATTPAFQISRVYDGLGREISNTAGGITTTTTYTSPTVMKKSMPGSTAVTTTTVDPNTNTTTVAAPDGTITTTVVNGLATTVTDANGHATVTTKDVWGRVVNVTPPAGPDVDYTYDELGRMLTVTRGGAVTAMAYDYAGHKLHMDDPDLGTVGTTTDNNWGWDYTYDILGNLTAQTDARGCVTDLTYDALNRLTKKVYLNCSTTTANVFYYYDGQAFTFNGVTYDTYTEPIGRRTGMVTAGSNAAVWKYDARGRLISEAKTIAGNTYTTTYAYNSADLTTSMTYPKAAGETSAETVFYAYNDRMLLESVGSLTSAYAKSITYDAAGRMTHLVRGRNGTAGVLDTFYDYNNWNLQDGRLQNLVTTRVSDHVILQNFGYSYDALGNILTITDAAFGNQTQNFTYDELERLKIANATGGTNGRYAESYSYNNATGNLASKGGVIYTYDTTHKHAVASLSNGNSYDYDANGNMTSRMVNGQMYTLAYDAENRLVSVTGAATATFVYDGDGDQVKATVNGVTTIYAGAHYEIAGSSVTKYYFAGSMRIAMKKDGTLSYILGDHLGSTNLVTDASGNTAAEMRYKAFGETRYPLTGSLPTDYQFTGQRNVAGIGLYFYGARFYDDQLGRFISADTVVPEGVQGYDRFAYGNNSPTRYTDPSGHKPCDDEFGCGGEIPKPSGAGSGSGRPSQQVGCTPAPRPRPHPSTVPVKSGLQSGSIYTTFDISTTSDAQETTLTAKAENGYDGWGGSGEGGELPWAAEAFINGVQIKSDMTNGANFYPMTVIVDWSRTGTHQTLVRSITIKTSAPTAVQVYRVTFSPINHIPGDFYSGDTVMDVPRTWSSGGSYKTNVDYAFQYAKMTVQLNTTNGFPDAPYVVYDFGNAVASACSK